MEVLSNGSVSWKSQERVSPNNDVVTAKDGDEKGAPAEVTRRAEKPMMVFISDPVVVDAFDKIEKVVLVDDRVLIGSRAFTCIRLTPEQAAKDKLLASAGKETPRIVFVTEDYKDTLVLEGSKLSVGGLWSAMQS